MLPVAGEDVVELREAGDVAELLAQPFSAGDGLGVVHEAVAHAAQDLEFTAAAVVLDGGDAVAAHEGETVLDARWRQLLAGGEVARVDSGGFYVQPAIFDGVNPHMTIAREEIFGPVLSVMAFNDVQEAVQLANDHVYGLQASIWTRDINCAHGVARALRAGTVHVNQYDEDDITVPFGGYKQSGVGRDKSLHAFDKYTELKTTWIRIDSPV